MPRAPRIVRVVPSGPVTRPAQGIPVVVRLRWHRGEVSDIEALAVAWAGRAVEVEWTAPWGDRRTDWVPASDVRRTGQTGPTGRAGGPRVARPGPTGGAPGSREPGRDPA